MSDKSDRKFDFMKLFLLLVFLGFAIIGGFSLILSFDAIRQEAIFYGVPEDLSWLVPVTIDALAIIGSMFLVFVSWSGATNMKNFGTAFAYGPVVLSVLVNGFHAARVSRYDFSEESYTNTAFGIYGFLFFVSPPLSLAVATHAVCLLMEWLVANNQPKALRQYAERVVGEMSLLRQQVKNENERVYGAIVDALNSIQANNLVSSVNQEVDTQRKTVKKLPQDSGRAEKILQLMEQYGAISIREMAKHIGCGTSAVQEDVTDLISKGIVSFSLDGKKRTYVVNRSGHTYSTPVDVAEGVSAD